MTVISFFSPMAFNAGPGTLTGDWVRGVLGDVSRFTVKTMAANEVVLTATAGSGLPGYTVVLTPVTIFTATPGGVEPMSGAVKEVSLYDPNGMLVSTVEDLPAGTSFSGLFASALGAAGAEFYGSEGADSITGFSGDDWIEGGAGGDVLAGGLGAAADVLIGGGGADTLSGGDGDDVFGAGDGADYIDGGDGTDGVTLAETAGPVEAWFGQAAPAGQIRIDNVEIVVVGDGGARLHGSAAAEVMFGGAGADALEGGGGDDLLAGDAGDDTLHGGDGDELMDGGAGADLLDGGSGDDWVDYSLAGGSLTIDLRLSTAQQTGLGLDTLVSIEGLFGSLYRDTLTGDASANMLDGWDGDDVLDGGDGDDDLYGGAGVDQVFGGAGSDTVQDTGGANYLRGGAGNDSITGGANFDDAHGNEGDDTVHGGAGDDWSVGGKDNDTLFGDEGGDVVYGNLGNDTCDGGVGADVIRGGQADDLLTGAAGDDWLSGDRGNDTVTGGLGADTFNSFGEAGIDRVTDFSRSEGDRVRLDAGSVYSATQVGADTVVTVTGGAQLVLVGVQLSTLADGWIYVG
jgi:Ca2+-binding RTX toxin-like protein